MAIERDIVMSGAHSYRGIERAVRGPHSVISETRGDTPEVAPVEAQVPRVIGDHGGIFASEIELLLAAHRGPPLRTVLHRLPQTQGRSM